MLNIALLWFDDDLRRPVLYKILDAAERFHERLGAAPTVCHLNPAQAQQAQQAQQGGSRKKRALPSPSTSLGVRLEADATLRPNYFLVGLDEEDASLNVPSPVDRLLRAENDQERPRRPRAVAAPPIRKRGRRDDAPLPLPALASTARARTPRGRVDAPGPRPPAQPRRHLPAPAPIAPVEASLFPPTKRKRAASPQQVQPATGAAEPRFSRRTKSAVTRAPAPAVVETTKLPVSHPHETRRNSGHGASDTFQPTLLESASEHATATRQPAPRGRTRRAS